MASAPLRIVIESGHVKHIMTSVRRSASALFFVLCVAVSIAGAYNVFSDNAEVRARAAEVACAVKKCGPRGNATMTRLERNPFAQSFEFATPAGPITVHCRRSAVFVGEYGCDKSD